MHCGSLPTAQHLEWVELHFASPGKDQNSKFQIQLNVWSDFTQHNCKVKAFVIRTVTKSNWSGKGKGRKGKKEEGRKGEDRAGMGKLEKQEGKRKKQESSGAPGLPPVSIHKAMNAGLYRLHPRSYCNFLSRDCGSIRGHISPGSHWKFAEQRLSGDYGRP